MDIDFLEFYVSRNRHQQLKESLHFPGRWRTPWPDDWQPRLSALESRLRQDPETSELCDLLQLNLLASLLTRPECLPENCSAHIARPEVVSRLIPGACDPERVLSARWMAFPVLLAISGRALIRYFVAGALPQENGRCGRPGWAEDVMDGDASEALCMAAAHPSLRSVLPENLAFFVFPLVLPGKSVQIIGRSLGLPACLAFHFLARSEPWPEHVAATGEIGAGDAVNGVGHLAEKGAEAAGKGFTALLYPLGNGSFSGRAGIEAIPVRTVDEALCFSRLYSTGRGRELILLSEMLTDPRAFVEGMERADPRWIDWVHRQGRIRPVMDAVFGACVLLNVFARNLRNMAADWKLDAAQAFIDPAGPEHLDQGAEVSPVSTLKLCTAALAVSNHRGDLAAAGRWATAGERVYAEARRSDLDGCADFLNNRLVMLHNRYRFEPGLGEEIESLLGVLEQRRQLSCAAGCEVDARLGELHGTIAQNFGFCGPGHLQGCIRHAMRAMDAFGCGKAQEFAGDFLRVFGYWVYAYLDAGDTDNALQALGAYTGAQGWDDLMLKAREQRLTRWHHAAVARFLAESPGDMAAGVYLAYVRDAAPRMIEEDHPWQLWLNNLGRIAMANRLPTSARRMFEESLRLCRLAKLGPTVRLMALLPLSGLRTLECLPGDMGEIEKEIRQAADVIDSERFNLLLEGPLAKALEAVWWKPEVFFPFTYR